MTEARPRLVPEREFPPYTYIPGRTPHPAHQAQGGPDALTVRDSDRNGDAGDAGRAREESGGKRQTDEYLYGIDLFNHGYYWEAHEVWEGLWHAAGRSGGMADFFKGLIKLAAAGVKTLEGSSLGRRRHASRAAELFARAADSLGGDCDASDRCWGLSLPELASLARQVAVCSTEMPAPPARPASIFDFTIAPDPKSLSEMPPSASQ